MKRRIIGILLTLAILFSCVPETFAAEGSMTDVSGHWAESYIEQCLTKGLFRGTTDTTFSPDGTMTRGMFVTVLGRLAGINAADYKDWYTGKIFTDVSADAYYAPYVAWAVRYGIAYGVSDYCFEPDAPVTRQQLAAFLVRYASIYNYQMKSVTTSTAGIVPSFTDTAAIASWASASVNCLREIGLLSGYPDGNGGYSFQPEANATRAECAAVFCRLSGSLEPYTERTLVMPSYIIASTDSSLISSSDTLRTGESTQLYYDLNPSEATNRTVTWISGDPSIATVNRNGVVTAHAQGEVEIYAYTCNGKYDSVWITCKVDSSLASQYDSYEERCYRLFGTTEVSDPRYFYADADEAASHMTMIAVDVWDFADSTRTTKITKTMYLQVNENLAETVKAIFAEIYNGDERFPIYAVGCYRSEPGSEHYAGCAIDINPNENYQCRSDGTALVGSYWKPGEDPYSIPLDGDVANAFAKYGFTQGAYWHNSRDYMHFSFFAT